MRKAGRQHRQITAQRRQEPALVTQHSTASQSVLANQSECHFTRDFLLTNQIQWKIHLAIIQLLAIISPQSFAHAMSAQLSCLVKNFIVIILLELW